MCFKCSLLQRVNFDVWSNASRSYNELDFAITFFFPFNIKNMGSILNLLHNISFNKPLNIYPQPCCTSYTMKALNRMT